MLRYVYERDEAVANAVARMLPIVHEDIGKCRAIGVIDEDGSLIAGFVYHHWSPAVGIIEISGAALPGRRFLTRETIQRMFSYPFDKCDCQMVLMHVPADNERLLRQLGSFGFSFVKVMRLFGRHRDGVICTLTEEEWRTNKFNTRRDMAIAQEEAA